MLFTLSLVVISFVYGTLNILINRNYYSLSIMAYVLAMLLLVSLVPVYFGYLKAAMHFDVLLISTAGYLSMFMGEAVSIKLLVLIIPILMGGLFGGKRFTAVIVLLLNTAVFLCYYPFRLISLNDTMVYMLLFLICGIMIILYQLYREYLEQLQISTLEKTIDSIIYMLGHTAEMRDLETGNHLVRVAIILRYLAERVRKHEYYKKYMTEKYLSDLVKASTLHDIGKIALPDHILLKPGKLTEEEYDEVKKHTTSGFAIIEDAKQLLQSSSILDLAATIALSHHERWDGRGYPDGLAGEEAPLGARLMAIADVYDALRSERPYKKAFSHEMAIQIISEERGAQFDPLLTDCFLDIEAVLAERLRDLY